MTVSPQPESEPLDTERRAAQDRLVRAVGEGRLTLDEFSERAGRVWQTSDRAELERIVADLPDLVVGQREPANSHLIGLIGDIRRSGRWRIRKRTTVWLLIGDVRLDLRGALIESEDDIEITVFSLVGDVRITVPEGIEVELIGFTVLGDRRVEVTAVPRVPGTPVVRVRVFSLIGDAVVRTRR